jgi:hypothetical protein
VVAVASESIPRVDPAPLFDTVTGFPPDDAIDLTVPMPLSLAIYMTMLESTGHPAQLAALRKLHIEQARETARSIQALVGDITGPDADASARLRISHIVEHRVPRVNGLRPHVHAYVGARVRSPIDGRETPVDVEQLAALGDSDLFPDHCARLVAATTERLGLEWSGGSSCELVGPPWLVERTAALRHDDLSCRGPWPRRQIMTGQQISRGT